MPTIDAAAVLTVLVAAYGFGMYYDPAPTQEPLAVLKALNKLARPPVENLTLALGYNVCVDAIVRWSEVIDEDAAGNVQPGERSMLQSLEDVHAAFGAHFGAGSAAERSCDAQVFSGLVARANSASSLKRSLGGNAALMARKLATAAPSARVVLNGHIGPAASALLPASIRPAAPLSPGDEVHLILEYAKGDRLRDASAPRANRFIITADVANTNSEAMVATIAAAEAADADVLVVAGLHMLEPLPAGARESSIVAIATALTARTRKFAVHVELASSADAAYMRLIADKLFPAADSVGFNEQEAAFLFESLGGVYGVNHTVPATRAEIASTSVSPSAVSNVLRWLMEAYPALSRLHYHSLPYHIMAYRADGARGRWRGTSGAVAAGAVAAAVEACRVSVIDAQAQAFEFAGALTVPTSDIRKPATANATWTLSSSAPVARWSLSSTVGDINMFLAPVPVCLRPISTVGLGDAISAAGIAADAVSVNAGEAPESAWEHTWPGLRLLRRVKDTVKDTVTGWLR